MKKLIMPKQKKRDPKSITLSVRLKCLCALFVKVEVTCVLSVRPEVHVLCM